MGSEPSQFLLVFERRLAWLVQRKALTIVLIGLISLTARALLLPILPIPKPAIQDEFSYLLAADTYAHGRLSNPTPALAEHFETLQVLMHPTYSSKYPPVSGLMMALGQVLTGQPWVGVWLATGILMGAICWALQGWLPAAWALAGSVIALLQIGIVSYWSESYWGGTCTAIGGTLAIGAVPRLIRRPRASAAVAFAAGLAILANTRPYEGLVLAVACSIYLVIGFARKRITIGALVRSVILPAACLMIPVAAWMSYYNYRVTGKPLDMPYALHERQYALWSPLLFVTHPAPTPAYSNALLRDFWVNGDSRDKLEARAHLVKTHISDVFHLARFYLGLPMTLCILAVGWRLWKGPAARGALLLLGGFYAGAAFDARLFPHYAAPATALAYVLAASAVRAARNAWPGKPSERAYVAWGLGGVVAITAILGLLTPSNRYLFGPIDYHVRAKQASMTERLEHEPGQHLVLVRYGARHEIYEELVYNLADIDRQKVIWARSLGPEKDQRLIRQYPGREVWLAEEDGDLMLNRYRTQEDMSTITTQLAPRVTGHF